MARNIVHGLAAHGYRTVCIGGVGFFNPCFKDGMFSSSPAPITAHREDGLIGHRTPQPVVWTVAFAHAVLKKNDPGHF